MDAIIASGTPDAITTTGGTNVIGRTYKGIVQDMLDEYALGPVRPFSGRRVAV